MDAAAMLDKAALITARQDVTGDNRELLLLFMNAARRAVLREYVIRKFFAYRTVSYTAGVIDGAGERIKAVRAVEYLDINDNLTALTRLKSLEEARKLGFRDFAETGSPKYYLEISANFQLIPVPTSGTVKIYGEFWPEDLTDSSSASDVTTVELPEAFIYLAAAEYFDYFDEAAKGELWRKKGLYIVERYLAEDKLAFTRGLGLASDPLGNGGVHRNVRTNAGTSAAAGTNIAMELNLGEWD
ncbi:MAG: hypothetical protein H6Q74_2191 [Firmicutes bacterium]|nr:hypothetical protein [Bacillota bacterium]